MAHNFFKTIFKAAPSETLLGGRTSSGLTQALLAVLPGLGRYKSSPCHRQCNVTSFFKWHKASPPGTNARAKLKQIESLLKSVRTPTRLLRKFSAFSTKCARFSSKNGIQCTQIFLVQYAFCNFMICSEMRIVLFLHPFLPFCATH